MLRPYTQSEGISWPRSFVLPPTGTNVGEHDKARARSLKRWMFVLPMIALFSVIVPGSHMSSVSTNLRRLTEDSIHHIYASSQVAQNLPTVPLEKSVPSYITLCQEWIHRDAYPASIQHFKRVENKDVCLDWTSPHYSMMDILSASIVSAVLPHGRYRHECGTTRMFDEEEVGCDHTTLQQAFPTPIISVNVDLISRYALKQQCKAALIAYVPAVEKARVKAYSFHHPFIWPVKPSEADIEAASNIVENLVGREGSDVEGVEQKSDLTETAPPTSAPVNNIYSSNSEEASLDTEDEERTLKDAFAYMHKYEDRVQSHHKREHEDEIKLQTGHSIDHYQKSGKNPVHKVESINQYYAYGQANEERHLKDAFAFMNKYDDRVKAHHEQEHADEVKLQTGHAREYYRRSQERFPRPLSDSHRRLDSVGKTLRNEALSAVGPHAQYRATKEDEKYRTTSEDEMYLSPQETDRELGLFDFLKKPRHSDEDEVPEECEPTRIIYSEDFETKGGSHFNISKSGWENGKIDSDGPFTHFLGRFGREDDLKYPTRSFHVDGTPSTVTIELDFYEIDNWVDPDCFYMVIGEDRVTFGAYFASGRDEGNRVGVSSEGIKWELKGKTQPSHLGFNPTYKDQIHALKVTLDPKHYKNGSFSMRLETIVNAMSSNRSAGFDNFKISAHYDCNGLAPTQAPSMGMFISTTEIDSSKKKPKIVSTALDETSFLAESEHKNDPKQSDPIDKNTSFGRDAFASTEVASPEPITVPKGHEKCQTLDFETSSTGRKVLSGAYVSDEFEIQYGVSISADTFNRRGGFTPDGKARIFETSNPGSEESGNPELGSPNQQCLMSGPGAGAGGVPGKKGENCKNLGNALIVQEKDEVTPKDNKHGGTITFDFVVPTHVAHIGLLNIQSNTDYIEVHTVHRKYNIHAAPLGMNSLQKMPIQADGVIKVVVNLHGPGAITELATCSKIQSEKKHPLPTYVIPLKTIVVPLQKRLEQTALAWANTTQAPPLEQTSGCLIYIEPTSYGINKKIFTRFIQQESMKCTSISVVTTPLCTTSNLPNGQPCAEYASDVYEQIMLDFPEIGATGFGGSPGIVQEIICSTAAAASRMMRAKFLMCPPHTPGCLLPAMGKDFDTSALLFETRDSSKPSEFFTIVGFRDRVKVVQVDHGDLPKIMKAEISTRTPRNSMGEPAASEYVEINAAVDDEGLPINQEVPPLIPASAVADIKAKAILYHLSPKLQNPKHPDEMTPIKTDPLAFEDRREKMPEHGLLIDYLRRAVPLNLNYLIPKEEISGGNPSLVSQQLGYDSNVGMATRSLDDTIYIKQSNLRQASIDRMHSMSQKGKGGTQEETSSPELNGEIRLELWCPTDARKQFEEASTRTSRDKLHKIVVPAKEFKFSSSEKLAELCKKHLQSFDTSSGEPPEISHALKRAAERRRAAAVAHAKAKAENRPNEIRYLSAEDQERLKYSRES